MVAFDNSGETPTSITTRYYYDGQRVLLETNYNGTTYTETDLKYFVYGNYIDEMLVMHYFQSNGIDFVFSHDHLYSPVIAYIGDFPSVSFEGMAYERYEYDAYGTVNIMSETYTPRSVSSIGNPYTFTGRRLDKLDGGNLNLMYYRARTYDPQTGRMMQRDPLGYIDGMNLYEYVVSAPTINVDPSGMKIAIACPAKHQMENYLKSISVGGYNSEKRRNYYEYSGKSTTFTTSMKSEIVGTMIRSERLFTIDGGTATYSLLNLKKHVDAREKIVNAAKTKKFGFQTGRVNVNSEFWVQVPAGGGYSTRSKGSDVAAAIGDIWNNPSKYDMACQAGTGIVMLRGISQAMGSNEFNAVALRTPFSSNAVMSFLKQDNMVKVDDWIPGDWGYVKNTNFSGRIGLEGENIIYVGNNKWWGHTGVTPTLLPLEGSGSWYQRVKGWDGGATILEYRHYPKLGLK